MSDNGMWNRLELSIDVRAIRQKLLESRVLLIGCGGIGSELSLRLAGCRIGHLTIIDGDTVSSANIPHSSLFLPRHVGQSKVEVVAEFLHEKFPELSVTALPRFIQLGAPDIISAHDMVVCAPDNDQTRLWVNYHSVQAEKPTLFIGAGGPRHEWTGYTHLYTPHISGCFHCFAKEGKSSGTTYGTLSDTHDVEVNRKICGGENVPVPALAPVIGVIASYAASIVLKTFIDQRNASYTYIDLKIPRFTTYDIKPLADCAVCGSMEEFEVPSIVTSQPEF